MIIDSKNIFNNPFRHILIDNFLPKELSSEMMSSFPDWEDQIWEKEGKFFQNEYGYKKELSNKNYMNNCYEYFFSQIENKTFIDQLQEIFELEDLVSDSQLYGGGLNLYPPGSELKIHTDFNYNSDIKMYRVVNLLYYLNDNINNDSGGNLDIYSLNLDYKKSILPTLNKCVIFAPNDTTYHGVSKNNNYYRKSISIWYYSSKPSKNLNHIPHKTKWLNK